MGGVAIAVVGDEVVAGHGGEDVAPADDGDAVGVDLVDGFPEDAGHHAVGVVVVHVALAEDDLAFAAPFVLGERGGEDGVGEDVEGDLPVAGGEGGVEDGAVAGGVGVDVAAGVGDVLGDAGGIAGGGALEDHVLEEVGEAAAKVLGLVDGAGADPVLDGDKGGGAVVLEEDGEAVVEDEAPDGLVGGVEGLEGVVGGGGVHGQGLLGGGAAGGTDGEEGGCGEQGAGASGGKGVSHGRFLPSGAGMCGVRAGRYSFAG